LRGALFDLFDSGTSGQSRATISLKELYRIIEMPKEFVRKLLQKSFLSAAVQKNRRRKPSAGAIVNEADPHYFYGFSPLFFSSQHKFELDDCAIPSGNYLKKKYVHRAGDMRRHSPRHRTHRKLWVQTFSVFRPYFQLLLFGFWFVVPGSTGEITP
jgi:hypothetical protein